MRHQGRQRMRPLSEIVRASKRMTRGSASVYSSLEFDVTSQLVDELESIRRSSYASREAKDLPTYKWSGRKLAPLLAAVDAEAPAYSARAREIARALVEKYPSPRAKLEAYEAKMPFLLEAIQRSREEYQRVLRDFPTEGAPRGDDYDLESARGRAARRWSNERQAAEAAEAARRAVLKDAGLNIYAEEDRIHKNHQDLVEIAEAHEADVDRLLAIITG